MRDFFTSSLAVLVTVTLTGSILATAIPLQQQASAFEIKDFKKLTHAFEKNVISGQWNPGDSPPIRELVDAYALSVMRLQPPDPVLGWLVVYQEGILTLFEHSPPSGHKPVLNDQIKEFRQLTHAFEKAVRSAEGPEE